MAEGNGAIYNNFKEQVMEGVFDLLNDTIQVTLHTGYSPDIDNDTVWGDISTTEYGAGSGYSAGGETLTTVTVTQDDTDNEGVFDAANVTWTSLGPLSPTTPSHAVLWDTTPTSPADPLICYFELGTTATNGGDYTLQWNSEGIINLT